ncbi:MAG TPA: hypothetical protein VLT89_09570 [Usitatibacter sp.]|nr:hypothetical protein [Usitatibacter sp.]
MNDEFRGHAPLPNEEELAWMSVEPFAAIRRVAVLVLFAFAVAMVLGPSTEPAVPSKAGIEPVQRERPDLEARGGVLVSAEPVRDSGWIPVATGMTLSALRPLE